MRLKLRPRIFPKPRQTLAVLSLLLGAGEAPLQGQSLTTYPTPGALAGDSFADLSEDYQITVTTDTESKTLQLYRARTHDNKADWGNKIGDQNLDYGGAYSFAMFDSDFAGPVTVEVIAFNNQDMTGTEMTGTVIRPQNLLATGVVTGGTVSSTYTSMDTYTFTLNAPARISIERDGKNAALLLFAYGVAFNWLMANSLLFDIYATVTMFDVFAVSSYFLALGLGQEVTEISASARSRLPSVEPLST